jgi:hypothetical protein
VSQARDSTARRDRMAEHPSAGEVWAARYGRAWDRVGLKDEVVRELYHELLEASAGGLQPLLVDGRWTDNPQHRDRAYYAAEERRLWGELGERFGIGPPPESFHA